MTFKQFQMQLFLLGWHSPQITDISNTWGLNKIRYIFFRKDRNMKLLIIRINNRVTYIDIKKVKTKGLFGANKWSYEISFKTYTRVIQHIIREQND